LHEELGKFIGEPNNAETRERIVELLTDLRYERDGTRIAA